MEKQKLEQKVWYRTVKVLFISSFLLV